MSPRLEADERANAALLPIAQGLLDELQDFGRLSCRPSHQPEPLLAYLRQRLVPTLTIVRKLEEQVGLRFAEPVAHGYILGSWPADVPIGGWTRLAPHQYVQTLLDQWEVAATGASSYLRLLRPAVLVLHEQGFAAAVRLLLDLHAAGMAIQESDLERVLGILLLARAAAEDDHAAVVRLLGAEPPGELRAWQDTQPGRDPQSPCDAWPAVCRQELGRLLERAVAAVAEVRRSPDNDRWFVGQVWLHSLLSLTQNLIAKSGLDVPIGAQAVLSQLSEIHADAFGVLMGAGLGTRVRFLGPSVADQLEAVHGDLGAEYRETFGDDWARRLQEERLKIPAAIGVDAALDRRALPPEWQGLSHRLATAFVYRFADGIDPALHRAGRFPPTTILLDPEVVALLDERDVPEDDRVALVASQYHGVVPRDHLGLFGDRELAEAVLRAHLRLGVAEAARTFQTFAARSGQAGDRVLELLDEQLVRYPWHDVLRYARAMAHAEAEAWDAALVDVVAAIVLSPTTSEFWQLLVSVLDGLGRPEEAALTQALHDALGGGEASATADRSSPR